jgi:hypothetical protein
MSHCVVCHTLNAEWECLICPDRICPKCHSIHLSRSHNMGTYNKCHMCSAKSNGNCSKCYNEICNNCYPTHWKMYHRCKWNGCNQNSAVDGYCHLHIGYVMGFRK